MKPPRVLITRAWAIAMLVADAGLSGCHKSDPPGQTSAIDLLHSGSPQICTSSEVQQTLHDMLMPKPADIAGDGTIADKADALNAISIAYRETTLQAFDQTVNRASCNTTLHIAKSDKSDDFDVTYQITPSADDPRLFVIAANLVDPKNYVNGLVADAATGAANDRQAKVDAAQQQQAKAQLIARLNPQWLAGRWINTRSDPSICAGDQGLTLAPNHMYSSQGNTGRWALDADQLHFIGAGGPGGAIDETNTITQADQESFTATNPKGEAISWRRCARAEIDPSLAQPTVPAGDSIPTQPQG